MTIFTDIIYTIPQGDLNALTPALLKKLGKRYIEEHKKKPRLYNDKSIADSLIEYAATHQYTSSENCADQLINTLSELTSFYGLLATNVISILNKSLNVDIDFRYIHRQKSNLELANEFYNVLIMKIKNSFIEKVEQGSLDSLTPDLFKAFTNQYLNQASKRPYFHVHSEQACQLTNYARENPKASGRDCAEQLILAIRNLQIVDGWFSNCIITMLNKSLDTKIEIYDSCGYQKPKETIANQFTQALNKDVNLYQKNDQNLILKTVLEVN